MGRGSSGSADYISAGRQAGVTAAQNKTIDKLIKQTRALKNEQYRIVDEDGNVVIAKRGSRGEVSATYGEKREYGQGAVTIHNHPEGGTFSEPDLNEFGFGVRQMVVASPEGTYRLTNLNWNDRMKRTSGWYDMREALRASGAMEEHSPLYYREQARKLPAIQRLANRMSSVSNQWVQARQRGASQSELDKLTSRYNELEQQYKTALRQAERKLEVKPYDDFYRANARKYGFSYTFTPR